MYQGASHAMTWINRWIDLHIYFIADNKNIILNNFSGDDRQDRDKRGGAEG